MDHVLSLEGDLYNDPDCETEDFGAAKLDVTKPIAESRYLGATVRISEIGFDREDAMVVDTLEVFRHWYELFQAVSVLSSKFSSK